MKSNATGGTTILTFAAAIFAIGCGKGHVHRGVIRSAATDLPCPEAQIRLEELEEFRFHAMGCGKVGKYRWVEGKPVLDGVEPSQ